MNKIELLITDNIFKQEIDNNYITYLIDLNKIINLFEDKNNIQIDINVSDLLTDNKYIFNFINDDNYNINIISNDNKILSYLKIKNKNRIGFKNITIYELVLDNAHSFILNNANINIFSIK